MPYRKKVVVYTKQMKANTHKKLVLNELWKKSAETHATYCSNVYCTSSDQASVGCVPYLCATHAHRAHTFASTLLATALRACMHNQHSFPVAVVAAVAYFTAVH